MSLLDKLRADQIEALKNKDELRKSTLRMVLAALQNEEIEKRSKKEELDDDDVQAVLRREAKKRKESIELYKEAGRDELALNEENELHIIKEYLPAEMNEEDARKIVKEEIEGKDNFGQAMGAVMKKISGRADPSLISRLVKEELGE